MYNAASETLRPFSSHPKPERGLRQLGICNHEQSLRKGLNFTSNLSGLTSNNRLLVDLQEHVAFAPPDDIMIASIAAHIWYRWLNSMEHSDSVACCRLLSFASLPKSTSAIANELPSEIRTDAICTS
eukprot:COSAG06_NODE_22028_length_737_cov_0.772727_1_plen_126_part_10